MRRLCEIGCPSVLKRNKKPSVGAEGRRTAKADSQCVLPPNDTPRIALVQRGDEADDGVAVEGLEPPMPERWFNAKYLTHDTKLMFKVAKVVLRFEIVEPGEFFGRKLERHFRASKLTHPPTGGREGRFVLNARSDLFAPDGQAAGCEGPTGQAQSPNAETHAVPHQTANGQAGPPTEGSP